MKISFMCIFCGKDTPHSIGDKFVDGVTTTSALICTECNNHPVHVKHDTDKLPTHSSERVLYSRENPDERSRKETQFCLTCEKEVWGRSTKKDENIIHFKCTTCGNTSEIIIPKRKH